MNRYKNVSPQGDQIVEGQVVKHGETFEIDADLDGNPNFEKVKHAPARKADATEGND